MDSTGIISGTTSEAGNMSRIWQKASVVAGLWAAVEIILGSFLHNLRVPFAGSILAAIGVVIMIGFQKTWPQKGMIWRAGLICALMKSVSPSALILGPMIGIMTEALLMELAVRVLGRNKYGYLAGGILSVSSALVHKIISLLILYGWNVVKIYVNLFNFLMKQIRLDGFTFWELLGLMALVYLLLGIGSSILGMVAGNRAEKMECPVFHPDKYLSPVSNDYLRINEKQHFSMTWFVVHLLFLPFALYLTSLKELYYSGIVTVVYLLLVSFRYPGGLRRLKKTMFWVQILILTVFSVLFWRDPLQASGGFDWAGFWIGVSMGIRAVLIVTAFTCLSIELRNPLVKTFLSKKGYGGLYQALTLSFSTLPVMIEGISSPRYFFTRPIVAFSAMFVLGDLWLKQLTDNAEEVLPGASEQ